ncbi:MAG: hypothetical protein KDA28_06820, partial [Phycisphaerales bacterium]|nr:hypothetical protein [Phycisphaerales bacterium]
MIDIATRKGLFVLDDDLTVRHRSFVGDSVTITHRIGDTIYAGLRLGHFGPKMHRSDDGGRTFEEIATPVLPEVTDASVNTAPDVPWKVDMLWALESDASGRLYCGTIPGALFESDDLGASWTLNRALWERPERAGWFGGGYD